MMREKKEKVAPQAQLFSLIIFYTRNRHPRRGTFWFLRTHGMGIVYVFANSKLIKRYNDRRNIERKLSSQFHARKNFKRYSAGELGIHCHTCME